MVFNSLYFLLCFPLIVLFYYLMPGKGKNGFLFVSSLIFYGCFHVKYVFLLLAVIFMGYYSGILLEKSTGKKKKSILLMNVAAIVLLLLFYKYLDFLFRIGEGMVSVAGKQWQTPMLSILVPVGISFYTLLTLGYLMDIYGGKIGAERDFISYGAFVSFFPLLLSGPIERTDNLLKQIKEEKHFSRELIGKGCYRMLWGYFQKVVIADRIAVLVTAVYDNHENYTGIYVLAATLLYAFQIYCDFAGYSNLAIGASEILGFRLRENFRMPYLAADISDFWKRWHVSLSSWLRDYVYIFLGGNRRGRLIKYRNLLLTFLVSGLWHGANFTFVIWGLIHGIALIVFDAAGSRLKEEKGCWNRVIKTSLTFLLVDFAWLFFRAESVGTAFALLKKLFFNLQPLSILNRQMAISMGMEIADLAVLAIGLAVLAAAEAAAWHKVDWLRRISNLPLVLRWSFLYASIFIILIFGYYGPGFDMGQFIYAQF